MVGLNISLLKASLTILFFRKESLFFLLFFSSHSRLQTWLFVYVNQSLYNDNAVCIHKTRLTYLHQSCSQNTLVESTAVSIHCVSKSAGLGFLRNSHSVRNKNEKWLQLLFWSNFKNTKHYLYIGRKSKHLCNWLFHWLFV